MQNIVIVGATSAIAEAAAKRFAKNASNLYLIARNEERLSNLVADLTVRGAKSAKYTTYDAAIPNAAAQVFNRALKELVTIDVLLVAHGSLSDQKACERSVEKTLTELQINALSVIEFATEAANYFENKKSGTIAVIGSVAGDRGRQSNYIYGTAKGMLSIFLQGLRNRLYPYGVQVITIKPGFVDTPMTASFKKGALWATADSIAAGIDRAIIKKSNVVYLPGFWRFIMLIICHIPERIFKKLKL